MFYNISCNQVFLFDPSGDRIIMRPILLLIMLWTLVASTSCSDSSPVSNSADRMLPNISDAKIFDTGSYRMMFGLFSIRINEKSLEASLEPVDFRSAALGEHFLGDIIRFCFRNGLQVHSRKRCNQGHCLRFTILLYIL